jgi:hypothetical protein
METRETLKRAWIGTPRTGSGEGTYGEFGLDPSIPLNLPEGVEWLQPLDGKIEEEMLPHRLNPKDCNRLISNLRRLQDEATLLDLNLPPVFVKILESEELRNRVPSYGLLLRFTGAFRTEPFQGWRMAASLP